jgi:nucleoside-diphosphate-sugar epimerase
MQEDDGRVVSNMISQALKDEDITIYGDGSQTRSFQYIDDLIDGVEKMLLTMNELSHKESQMVLIEPYGSYRFKIVKCQNKY